MDTVNRETEASLGGRNPSHTQFNVLPIVALSFLPLVHPAVLGLFLQFLAGRKSHYDWAGITAGAIRKVILEVATLL